MRSSQIPSGMTQIGKPRRGLAIPDQISKLVTASQFFEAVGLDAESLAAVSFLNLCARMQSFGTCTRMRRPGFQDLMTGAQEYYPVVQQHLGHPEVIRSREKHPRAGG